MNNKIKLSIFAGALTVPLIFFACKGKEGSRGPAGAGFTQTIYTGAIPTKVFDISASALTTSSTVEVYVSSTSGVSYTPYTPETINYSTKIITTSVGDDFIGGIYKAFVNTPS